VPRSFGPPQEDVQICVETPEGEQEPQGNRASEHTYIAIANIIVRRSMASLWNGVKNRAGNFAIEVAYGSKCEELNVSKSSPPRPTERTSMRRAATSPMGQEETH
jgi:hypothetical protein